MNEEAVEQSGPEEFKPNLRFQIFDVGIDRQREELERIIHNSNWNKAQKSPDYFIIGSREEFFRTLDGSPLGDEVDLHAGRAGTVVVYIKYRDYEPADAPRSSGMGNINTVTPDAIRTGRGI